MIIRLKNRITDPNPKKQILKTESRIRIFNSWKNRIRITHRIIKPKNTESESQTES